MDRTPTLSRRTLRAQRGVTLMELMIVVVIVSILAAIAYPAYQNQIEQTRRADGKAALMDSAQRLERCFTRANSYLDVGGSCPLAGQLSNGGIDSPEAFYRVSIADGALTQTAFTLQAAPQNAQAGDTRCGTLMLDSRGRRGSQGNIESDQNDCW